MSKRKSALDVFKEKQNNPNTSNTTTPQHSNVIQSSATYKARKVYKNVPWYPPTEKLKKELKKLALDEETSMSNLITEGIVLVFEKRGKNVNEYL